MNEVQRANRDMLAALFYEFNIHPDTLSELSDLNRNYRLGIKEVLVKSSISPWEGWLIVSRTLDGTAATINEQYYSNAYGVLLNDLNASTLEIHADKLEVRCDAPRTKNFPLPVGWSWRVISLESITSAGEEAGPASSAPASDRLVSLSHNQSVEIEKPLEAVIQELEADNGSPEDPTFRQRMLGQLRAGRELVRAGEFKLALFYLSVITALNELVVRYRDGIIAGLATNLLQYLITNGFGQ